MALRPPLSLVLGNVIAQHRRKLARTSSIAKLRFTFGTATTLKLIGASAAVWLDVYVHVNDDGENFDDIFPIHVCICVMKRVTPFVNVVAYCKSVRGANKVKVITKRKKNTRLISSVRSTMCITSAVFCAAPPPS